MVARELGRSGGWLSSVEAVCLLLPEPCGGHPLGLPLKEVDLVQELLVGAVRVAAIQPVNRWTRARH